MILAAHAIIGGALGSKIENPFLAFLIGFLSHFVLDAIPHWDYHLKSKVHESTVKEDMILDRRFARDVIFLGIDFFGGVFISLLIFQGWGDFLNPSAAIFWGAIGGTAPDALQFLSWKIRKEPLLALQKFHVWIHARKKLTDLVTGPAWQAGFVVVVVLIARFVF